MAATASHSLVDLTRDLRALPRVGVSEELVDDLLRRGLDWVGQFAPYDLATIFELNEGELVVRAARGKLAGPEVRRHRIELARFPTLREALETRRARAYTEDDHAHGDGDPFDGVLDLPAGHSCMVVPLCAGDRCFGVLALDRTRCEPYAPETVSLVEVYGQVLALALLHAEQEVRLTRLHRQDHEHSKMLEATLAGDPFGVLESSRSPVVQEIVRRARQVATTTTPVLILGETGTGKERLARALHLYSDRAEQPFVALNCAAIPEALLESELFGHVKGAFTGATRDRPGRFQLANGGTLLLDEIGELPFNLQAKLLRVLQDGTFEPVGSDRTTKVDVRFLAATHRDLHAKVQEGRFREDLLYRLNVFPLRMPPLRERLEDLPSLCTALLSELAGRTGRRGLTVSKGALDRLARYDWPGNVRELANVLERASILTSGREIGASLVELGEGADHGSQRVDSDGDELLTLEEIERRHIRRVLARTRGKIYGEGGAAAVLGLKPSTLQSRMKKLGLERPRSGRVT